MVTDWLDACLIGIELAIPAECIGNYAQNAHGLLVAACVHYAACH